MILRARRGVVAGLVSLALVSLNMAPAFAPPSGGGGGGSGTAATFVDYAQCANGAPPNASLACPSGWINGILQGSNSHYHEDEVTPQRLTLEVPAGSPTTGRTAVISYMTRKGSAPAHAYDSLATWNYTQTQADRCQGLTTSGKNPTCALPTFAKIVPMTSLDPCTGINTPCRFQMATDLTAVPPATANGTATSGHELPAPDRQWAIFGGSITDSSTPTHDSDADPTTDDFATVKVTYSVPDTTPANGVDKATKVQFLFGGHLAASDGPRGWGAGLGAGSISGGPYHIKLQSADGASLGSKDNQIQSSAVIAGSPQFTVSKSAQPTTSPVKPGDTVNYTITVTNTGSASGATSFVDDYDDRITITSVPFGCQNNVPSPGKMTCVTTTISNVAPGNTQSFTYSATMPAVFTGPPGGSTACSPTQYPVINTVTLANNLTASSTVCVNASPTFSVSKTASPSSTTPGGTVQYTITVTNSGSAPGSTTFVDDYDNRITDMTVPAGCENNKPSSGMMTCTTGQISPVAPNNTEQFVYTAKMPLTFTTPTGGSGCSATQQAVVNTVTITGLPPASSTVCVNVSPTFSISKTASPGRTTPGGTVQYTITVTNSGSTPGSTTFVDDYDNRITDMTVPAGCQNNVPSSGKMTCTTDQISPVAPNNTQQFVYTAKMPLTFNTPTGGSGCSSTQQAVVNTVTITGLPPASSTVCVDAAPRFDVTKSVTNPAGNPPTTTAGGIVTYAIKVKNIGTSPGSDLAKDTYAPGVTISGLPIQCSDNTITRTVTCNTGTLNPGDEITFSYQATMPSTFSGASGTAPCQPGQYPVINTVVVTGDSATVTVCVNATPNLTLAKSANVSSTGTGGTIVYTLTYNNTGAASASGVTIVEDLPAGTAYSSCTGGCVTNGPPITRATWNIGTVPAKSGPLSVTLTVTVTATDACQICNTAKIASPDFNGGNPVSSNPVCIPSTPGPNPAGAHASGDALGAKVVTKGLIGLVTTDLSTAASSQSGVGGPQIDSETVLAAAVPSGGAVLSANVLRTTSASVVTASPAEARDTSTAEVLGVCILPIAGLCTVESSTVRAVASTVATGSSASHSDAGSTIENLKIAGLVTPVDLNAPLKVDLNPLVFGSGSYVAINERESLVTTPPGSSGGTYAADLTVTMIHVHVTGLLLGIQAADVTVAKAHAHSDFPQTAVCSPANGQSVSGHAFVASLFTTLPLANLVQGYVGIPSSGGSQSQHIAGVAVPASGSIVTAQAADTSSVGTISATQSKADSVAEVAGNNQTPACLLKAPTSCLISAKLVHSESHSVATAAGATSNDSGTALVNLKVLGISIAGTPNPNTTIVLPGIGFVVLNEQFCDNGAKANHSCAGADHSGLTVRSLRVVVNQGNNVLGLLPGVELIVAEAHSDATFVG